MDKQCEQHQPLTKDDPSIPPINPALLKVPTQKPKQDIQILPPKIQQPTGTSLLPALIPQQEVETLPVDTTSKQLMVVRERFPHNLPKVLDLVLGQDGKAYSIRCDSGNPYILPVGSKHLGNIIREYAQEENRSVKKGDLNDINAMLQAHAERSGIQRYVWYRVAPVTGGIEIDLGDERHTRIRITAGKVDIINSGSDVLFFRTPVSNPMAMPAQVGDLKRLNKYLNMHPTLSTLLIGWISFVMAHPKHPTSKYPILVLNGGQGCGKSSLCNYILRNLIDPNRVGLQILPNNSKDIAIAAQNSHVLYYDNVREFSHTMADILCVAATGGVLSARQLYTDADQQLLNLHVALVLNGIHSFITQPDLAQRCLPIHLSPIPEEQRMSDAILAQGFQADLPYIMRGIFDLIAEIFQNLPDAKPTNPERMIDFVRWLAAMEMAQGVPAGIYQMQYSGALRHGQLDSLQENVLAAAILDLSDGLPDGHWTGTPDELLNVLNRNATKGTLRSRDWPVNAISLSKRLGVLEAGLKSQGIDIIFSRGKKRNITIRTQLNGGF